MTEIFQFSSSNCCCFMIRMWEKEEKVIVFSIGLLNFYEILDLFLNVMGWVVTLSSPYVRLAFGVPRSICVSSLERSNTAAG